MSKLNEDKNKSQLFIKPHFQPVFSFFVLLWDFSCISCHKLVNFREHVICKLLLHTFFVYVKSKDNADYTCKYYYAYDPSHYAARFSNQVVHAFGRRVEQTFTNGLEDFLRIVWARIKLFINSHLRSREKPCRKFSYSPFIHDSWGGSFNQIVFLHIHYHH